MPQKCPQALLNCHAQWHLQAFQNSDFSPESSNFSNMLTVHFQEVTMIDQLILPVKVVFFEKATSSPHNSIA